MSVQDDIDSVLVERFAHGNGTVFVGAGISLGSRMPSWQKLMEPLRADLGEEAGRKTDYLHIAELYQTKHNRSVLVQYLKERLGDVRFQLTKTHELIVGLPVQRIYTTNFDTLLEQASQKKQINRNVIVNASHVGYSDTSTLSIVKLHGDLGDPESIVISASDYYSYFARNPAVADLLKVELQTHTVLFLGYSFSDPNLGMILGNAAMQSGSSRPLLYSLQFRPGELSRRAMDVRGVKVISLDAEPGTPEADWAIEDWLRRFRQSLITFERRKSRFATSSTHPGESALPALRKTSIRRLKMSERIKTGLHSDFRVVVVKGEAGIGKTQLVAEAAADSLHAAGSFMSDDAFERIVWIKASFEAGRVGHTLEGILDAIANNVDTLLIGEGSDSLQKKQSDINVILQERRLLVVIEDFEDPTCDTGNGSLATPDKARIDEFTAIKKWLENAGPYANPMSRIIVTSRSAIVAGFVIEIAKLDADEATELLREQAHAIMLRRHRGLKLDAALEQVLLARTTGNPQAIKLALGLCNGTCNADKLVNLATLSPPGKIEGVFKVLVGAIMEELKQGNGSVPDIVVAMMVFPTEEWVPASLVESAAGGGEPPRDRKALTDQANLCVSFGLLEHDACADKYLMRRTIREALEIHIDMTVDRLDKARRQLAEHLLAFVEEKVCRPEIADDYWKVLVRDEMARIDPCWPIIEAVMYREGRSEQAWKFALLLVHYMDSRFLNNQRLHFIRQALNVPGDEKKHLKALLHIDALAWTFMEEGANGLARAEIREGLKLVSVEKPPDLRALAYAWYARIDASEGKKVEASINIDKAIACARKAKKNWIWMRVKMMAGDVALMNDNPKVAVDYYMQAAECAEFYGGEGDGYQTSPRIGLALLAVRDKKGAPDRQSMEKARRRFAQLVDNSHVATGRLYGQYGLALIAARENLSREARRQLEKIQKEIQHHSKGNVLLTLAKKSYQDITNAGRSAE